MYVITNKGKPATLVKLYKLNGEYNRDGELDDMFIVAKTQKGCIESYIRFFGYTWKERPDGIGCYKTNVVSSYDEKEGHWIISNNANGIAQIQKLDESKIFKGDNEALKHVIKLAAGGNKKALAALVEVNTGKTLLLGE